jgi:hypothetical protein
MNKLTDFAKGIIVGVISAVIIFGVISLVYFKNRREKEIIRYVEIQKEIEALQKDYGNRDPVEFFDSIPGVRESADGAIGEFERKRDEALQRFRGHYAD